MSERFYLRTSGLPYERIELDPEAASSAEDAVAAWAGAVAALDAQSAPAHAALNAARSELSNRARRRTRQAILRRRPVALDDPPLPEALAAAARRWNTTLAARDAAEATLSTAFATTRATARQALWDAAASDDFQEAVLLLSAGAHRTLSRWLAGAPTGPPVAETATTRKSERRLYLYLQRFCTKAETTSFVGPIAGGRLDPTAPAAVTWTAGPAFLLNRRVYPAGWLVRAAVDTAAATFADVLPLRRSPDAFVRDGRLVRYVTVDLFGRELRDVGPLAALSVAWERVDGARSRAALLAEDPGQTEALDTLLDAGAVTCRPLVSRQERDGLAALSTLLRADLGDRATSFCATLDDLSARIQDFAAVPGPGRPAALAAIATTVEATFDIAAFRNAGKHYADRYPFFEDATRDVRGFTLGAPFTGRLGLLDDVLDLWLAAKLPAHRFRVSRFHRWLDDAFDGADRVPLTDLVARWQRARTAPDDVDRDYLSVAKLHVPDGVPKGLKRALVEAAEADADTLAFAPGVTPALDAPTLSSADLLLLPPRPGDPEDAWRLVLGEAHRMVCAFRFFLDDLPDEDAFVSEIDALLAEARAGDLLLKPYDTLDAKLSYRYLSPEFVDFDPDGRGPADRPSVTWSDLALVRADDGAWHLEASVGDAAPRRARFLFAGPRELGGAHAVLGASANAKGLPPRNVARLPRVVHEDLVVLRACWALDASELTALQEADHPARTYARTLDLLTSRGVPRHCFVRSDPEPKPIYLDLLNPVAHDLLATLARAAGDGRLVFSEMLPGPADLWFRDARGRYIAELRTNLIRTPQEPQ